jgi:hypothetical protein
MFGGAKERKDSVNPVGWGFSTFGPRNGRCLMDFVNEIEGFQETANGSRPKLSGD